MKNFRSKIGTDELSAAISEGVQHALTNLGFNSPKNENELFYLSIPDISEWIVGIGGKITKQGHKYLEKEKTKYDYEVRRMWHRFHEEIHTLSKAFFTDIGNYFFKKKETAIASADDPVYFGMRLISAIHTECNNEQFEAIAEKDLYDFLNGRHTENPVKVKLKEKTRTCYLLHKLHEMVPADKKEEWLKSVLFDLGIGKGLYISKYKEAQSESSSDKSLNFVKNIDKIFADLNG
ncbi:MAG: hypothetical protein LBE82_00175 [Chitinophagaceae bacterium]|jgi:hypothetical protein|nr:hypothetical protein [Chitinophagaceae bacterium]